jgi:SAM-dependent methyltransferase
VGTPSATTSTRSPIDPPHARRLATGPEPERHLPGAWHQGALLPKSYDDAVVALPPDYDTDPDRWGSRDPDWRLAADVHEMVAARVVAQQPCSVLDVGSGRGRLREVLPAGWPWIGIDSSPSQLRSEHGYTVVLGDGARLPFSSATFGAVAALYMLYHLDDPTSAIAEALRVLAPGGLFFACTRARTSDPELTDGYPPTTFDAEDAPRLVAAVFGDDGLEVISWDGPLLRLPNDEAIGRYLRTHHLPASVADRVTAPLTVTKRGCLIIARRAS